MGSIIRWPFVTVKRVLLALAPSQVGAPADVWPVAGLDAERASCILYALRQAAATEEVHFLAPATLFTLNNAPTAVSAAHYTVSSTPQC